MSTFLGKLTDLVFGSVFITSLLLLIYTPIVIMTWLICCKVLWCFYYADTKDIDFSDLDIKDYFYLLFEIIKSLFGVNIFMFISIFIFILWETSFTIIYIKRFINRIIFGDHLFYFSIWKFIAFTIIDF